MEASHWKQRFCLTPSILLQKSCGVSLKLIELRQTLVTNGREAVLQGTKAK
jgi:hypothetical protein